MEDGEDKVAEKAKFRHPAIPGGLLEPEQRNTGIDDNNDSKTKILKRIANGLFRIRFLKWSSFKVKLALKMQPKKMIQRNNVKKTFTIKKKR